jgi:mRNA interferase MazF
LAKPTEHGEIWLAMVDKRRPVVIVSRDDLHGRRDQTTVAPITRTVHGIPTEVFVDHREGLPEMSVVNCDVLQTIYKSQLERRVGRLSELTRDALDDALRFALQLR